MSTLLGFKIGADPRRWNGQLRAKEEALSGHRVSHEAMCHTWLVPVQAGALGFPFVRPDCSSRQGEQCQIKIRTPMRRTRHDGFEPLPRRTLVRVVHPIAWPTA